MIIGTGMAGQDHRKGRWSFKYRWLAAAGLSLAVLLPVTPVAGAASIGDMLGAIAGRGEYGRDRNLDEALQRLAGQMNRKTPMQVSEGYRLDRVTAESGSELVYHYTMLNQRGGEVTAARFNTEMAPLIRSRLCQDAQMAPLLKSGARVGYAYRGSDGVNVGKLSFRQSDCGPDKG